jgi:hypothetical protein
MVTGTAAQRRRSETGKIMRKGLVRMRGTLRHWVLVGSALAAVAPATAAQSITAGSVQGVVVRDDGGPVADAIVTLRDITTGLERWAETAPNGGFAFGMLYPGMYELKAEQLGYKPTLVRDVRVSLGEKVILTVAIVPTTPPVTEIDSANLGGTPISRPGAMFGFPYTLAERMPLDGRDLAAFSALHTRSDDGLVVDGLPERFTDLSVDGVTHGVARHVILPTSSLDAVGLPLLGYQNAGILHSPTDLEWGDFTGDLLGGFARRGTQRIAARLFADFSGTPGASSDYFAPNDVDHSSWRGGLVLGGPIVRDTARFAIGGEAQRLQVPTAAPNSQGATVGADSVGFGGGGNRGGQPRRRSVRVYGPAGRRARAALGIRAFRLGFLPEPPSLGLGELRDREGQRG